MTEAPPALSYQAGATQPADDLALRASLALLECRALAAEAELVRAAAATARNRAAYALHEAGWSVRAVAAELDVSPTLAHRYIRSGETRS